MSCPACRSANTRARYRIGDRLFRTTDEVFAVERCADCGLSFLSPTPAAAELAAYYPDGYWTGPGDRGLRSRLTELYRRFVLSDHVRFIRRVIREQQQAGRDVSLLDIGCGDGSFLELCGSPKRCGVDTSLGAARAARARGIDVAVGTLDDCPVRDASCSIVTMYHVLEHVCPAEPTLATVRRLLADDGDFVVQVPNAASWQATLLGGHWAGLDVPRHLMNYTPAILRRVLERNGFRVVRESQFSVRDNPTALANSIVPGCYPPARAARNGARNGARDGAGGGAGGGGLAPWLSDLTYLAVTLAGIPFTFVESLCGRGGTIMVQARKVG